MRAIFDPLLNHLRMIDAGSSAGVTGSGTANELTYWTGTTSLGSLSTATYPSLVELSYVKGVTSSIQTQLNNRWSLSGNATGNDTSFIGTTDNQTFLVKTNNTTRLTFTKDGSVYNSGLGAIATNTVFGLNALLNNTTGYRIVAFGDQALQANTEGYENAAIGSSALLVNTTGAFNIAIGYAAMEVNTTGSVNIAIGGSSMGGNTTGSYNIAIGNQAASGSGTGQYNVAIGFQTLAGTGDNSNNTAVGYHAGRSVSTGSYNTFFGYRAAFANNTGISNVAIGHEALFDNLTGGSNTALGLAAGHSSTGSGSVFIGYAAGYYETASNKLFIDNAQRTNEADGRVKALVYGKFDSTLANQFLTINGNLGFNTSTFGTSADGVIAMKDATTVPTSSPANTIQLYPEGGQLKYRDSLGNTITL